jgi:hypothetical protein
LSGAFQVATNRGGNRQQSVRIGGLPDALARPHKALLPRHQAAAAHGLQGVVDGAGLNSPGIGRRRRVGRVTPAVCAKVLQQGETNPLAFGGHAAGGGVGLQQIAELGALVPVQPPAPAVAKDAGAVPGMGCAVDMASRSSVEPRPGEVATRQADPVARRGLQKARRVGRIAFSRVRSSRLCRTFGGHLHGWPLAFRGFWVSRVWAVDRLGRSLPDLIGSMQEMHGAKVDLFMLQQGIDTTTPGGKAMFQMLGVFGEFERSMIQARVKVGMARAMEEQAANKERRGADGRVRKAIGRPKVSADTEKTIRARLAAGAGILKMQANWASAPAPCSASSAKRPSPSEDEPHG